MRKIKQSHRIIAILDDLFFYSKIREAAKPLNLELEFIKNPNGLSQKIKSEKPSLLIFDLNSKSCNPLQIIKDLKSSPELKNIPILGYLSHVQTELKEKAVEAGCDLVLPRSRLSKDLREILMRYSRYGLKNS
ncbi:MAG: response regulator [Deltaproteobacteria bacterium]|nr:response regulator [Deltaproteobacteria bacterium]